MRREKKWWEELVPAKAQDHPDEDQRGSVGVKSRSKKNLRSRKRGYLYIFIRVYFKYRRIPINANAAEPSAVVARGNTPPIERYC